MLIKGEDMLKITYPDNSTINVYYRDGSVQHIGLMNGVLLYDCDTDEIIATSEQIRYIKKLRRIKCEEAERQNKSARETQGCRN